MALHVMEEASRCLGCKKPRCQEGCPIHTNIPEVIRLLKSNKLNEAGEYTIILPYTFDDTKVKVNGSYCKTFEYAGRLCASFNYSGNGQMEVSVEQKANGILPGTILSVLAVLCLVAIPISQRYNEKKRRCAEGNNKNA